MNVGITAVGAHIPYYRLRREAIAQAWERNAIKGEKSVANTDEDSVTMAVEAAVKCFRYIQREDVSSLLFASTTAPYAEKSQSGLIAVACDLGDNVFTADFAQCTKAGSSALKAAMDAVKAGSDKNVLVTAADCRLGYPRSDEEQLLGDAAAAIAIGAENAVAMIESFASVNNEIIDVWRNYGDQYLRTAEKRFAMDKGYFYAMTRVVKDVLKNSGLGVQDISKAVFATPGLKDNQQLGKQLGFAPTQIQDSLMLQVGNCGTAQPLLMLIAALEQANPGDRILMASYGNGADAFIFQVTENIAQIKQSPVISECLKYRKSFQSYSRYLSFRGLVETVPGEPFRTFPSNSAYWRDQKSILRFHGSHCQQCGAEMFPINRVCGVCGAKDDFSEVRCSDRNGKVFTYSIDHLAGRSDDPTVVQTVVEDEAGTRYYMLMTDFDPAEVKVGMDVAFTFRKIYEGGNYINYFWKCRPVRKGGAVL